MIVQERNKTNWMDAYICESKEDAKKYIKKQIQEGKRAEDFRIITNLIECRTEVVFLEKSQPPKEINTITALEKLVGNKRNKES